MLLPILIVVAAPAAWLLTAAVRRYALARSVLDVPNERSSHERPTPRAGGLAVAFVFIAWTAIALWFEAIPAALGVALLGGVPIIIVGWIDDHGDVSRGIRAALHLVCAAWAAAWLGGLPGLDLGTTRVSFGAAGFIFATLGIAWLINLYNFMDGIDGIAAGEAVSVGMFAGALLLLVDAPALAFVAFVVATASAGFLAWNWTPARIFMGDVGSGFLGFVFGTLALASERTGAVPLLGWLVLLGVFVFDASFTLGRRVLRGEKWYREHQNHAYQRAVRSGLSHAQVTTRVLVANAVLAVLAGIGTFRGDWLIPCTLVALAFLGGLYGSIERRLPMRVSSSVFPTGVKR